MGTCEDGDYEDTTPVRVTDKRKVSKDGEAVEMPTAEQLLNDSADTADAFQQQHREEQARLAEWDAMSDEEKQEVLARQAAETQGVPYAGGGMQAPPNEHAGKKAVLTVFTIVVHRDGTAVASDNLDLSIFEPEFPVDAGMIYRAVCEIKKDIESTDAATATLQFMNMHATAIAQRQQAAALAQGLGMRGQKVPRGGG